MLLSTYDSRGGIEPLVALAARLRELGAEPLMCAPPDCAQRLAEAGVPLVPVGEPVRRLVHGAAPPSMADVPRRIDELIAAWFGTVTAAAEGCNALVASGLMPAAADARSVADKLGIPSVHVSYCPIDLPSPQHRPQHAALTTALTPQTRTRATSVKGTIRTDGADTAARLLIDAINKESRT